MGQKKKGTTQEFQITTVDSKISNKHPSLKKADLFFCFRYHMSFQLNTSGHKYMSHCSTKLPDWQKLCETVLVSRIEMRKIEFSSGVYQPSDQNSRYFDSLVQRSHIIQPSVIDWEKVNDWCGMVGLFLSGLI